MQLQRICWQPGCTTGVVLSYPAGHQLSVLRICQTDRIDDDWYALRTARSGGLALSTFKSLGITPRLLETLSELGYKQPTPIQEESIPPVLQGNDLLGCAQTGTGKTAAFLLPLIERLCEHRPRRQKGAPRRPRALILAPTRELAGQIKDSLHTYARGTGLRHTAIYGGVKQFRQVKDLRAGVDIIVGTPGRMIDLMDQGHIDLTAIEFFVLDEADCMLDMGFVEPIKVIGRQIPPQRQTLFFSATMPPKIRQLADTLLNDPVTVSVDPVSSTAPLIDQTMYHVPAEHKPALLSHLLDDEAVQRSVVFTKTKHGAEKLAKRLSNTGVDAGAIHGNKTQSQRQRALKAFRDGRFSVLVATDVAARGLDVDGITHVFNFNLPRDPEAYVHRIGRTGRAGATGQAISLCSKDERGALKAIERLTGETIDTSSIPEHLDIPEEAPPSRNSNRYRGTRTSRKQTDRSNASQAPAKPKDKKAPHKKKKRSTRSNNSALEQKPSRPQRPAKANGPSKKRSRRKPSNAAQPVASSGSRPPRRSKNRYA